MIIEKLSFIIPCYKSENHLEKVVSDIVENMGTQYPDYEYEIILINDGSPDKTWDVILNLSSCYKAVIGVNLAQNFGQHAAIMAGYRIASGSVIVGMDDDGEHSATDLHILMSKLNQGFDYVCGQYKRKKDSFFRNIGTKTNNAMAGYFIGKPKGVDFSSFYVLKRYIVEEIIKYDNPFPYIAGLILRATKNIAMVEVPKHGRISGSSNYNFKGLIRLWLNGFTAFSVKPLRIMTVLGFLLATVGVIFSLIIVFRRIFNPDIMLGWSSLISAMLFLFGITFVMLGLLGEYIGRIYICINNSPQYVIKQIIKNVSDDL